MFFKSRLLIFLKNFYYLYFILGVNALFISTFWGHFYFSPYIFILPLLVPNPINACYFNPFHQPTMEIADVANGLIKILIKIHHGSCHPCHMDFPPLYVTHDPHYNPNQYQKPKIPQINTRNPKSPKSIPETLNSQNSSLDLHPHS